MSARYLARVVSGTKEFSGRPISRLRRTVTLIGHEIPPLAGGIARRAFHVPSRSGEVASVTGGVSPGRREVALLAVIVALVTAQSRLDLVATRICRHRVNPN